MNGIADASSALLEFSSSMETAAVSLEYFVDAAAGTKEAASQVKAYLREVNEFAARTPFSTADVLTLSKYMQAVGISMSQTQSVLSVITDTAAATGASTEQLERITFALGQIMTKGRIANEEIRQLANANIPIYAILQEELNLTGEQISNIGKYWISADDAIVAILDGLNKRYAGAADRIAETFAGLTDTIVDDAKIIANEAFGGFYDKLVDATGTLRDTMDHWREIATEKGLPGLFNDIVLEIDPSGQLGNQLLQLAGNIVNLKDEFIELYHAARPVLSVIGRSMYVSANIGLVALTALCDVAEDVLNALDELGISTSALAKGLASLYIAYQAAKVISFLGEGLSAAALSAYNASNGILSLLPASLSANAGVVALTASVATLVAYLAAAAGLFYSFNSFASGISAETDANGLSKSWNDAYDEYESKLAEMNEQINAQRENYTESYKSLSDGTPNISSQAKDSSGKSSSSNTDTDWVAAFDEVYDIPDKNATANYQDAVLADLTSLLDLLGDIKFPKIIFNKATDMPTLGNIFGDDLFNESNPNFLKSLIPAMLVGLAPMLGNVFSRAAKTAAKVGGKEAAEATGKVKNVLEMSADELHADLIKNSAKLQMQSDDVSRILAEIKNPKTSAVMRATLENKLDKLVKAVHDTEKRIGDVSDALEQVAPTNTMSPAIYEADQYLAAKNISGMAESLLDINKRLEEVVDSADSLALFAEQKKVSTAIEKALIDYDSKYGKNEPLTAQVRSVSPLAEDELDRTLKQLLTEGLKPEDRALLEERLRTLVNSVTTIQEKAAVMANTSGVSVRPTARATNLSAARAYLGRADIHKALNEIRQQIGSIDYSNDAGGKLYTALNKSREDVSKALAEYKKVYGNDAELIRAVTDTLAESYKHDITYAVDQLSRILLDEGADLDVLSGEVRQLVKIGQTAKKALIGDSTIGRLPEIIDLLDEAAKYRMDTARLTKLNSLLSDPLRNKEGLAQMGLIPPSYQGTGLREYIHKNNQQIAVNEKEFVARKSAIQMLRPGVADEARALQAIADENKVITTSIKETSGDLAVITGRLKYIVANGSQNIAHAGTSFYSDLLKRVDALERTFTARLIVQEIPTDGSKTLKMLTALRADLEYLKDSTATGAQLIDTYGKQLSTAVNEFLVGNNITDDTQKAITTAIEKIEKAEYVNGDLSKRIKEVIYGERQQAAVKPEPADELASMYDAIRKEVLASDTGTVTDLMLKLDDVFDEHEDALKRILNNQRRIDETYARLVDDVVDARLERIANELTTAYAKKPSLLDAAKIEKALDDFSGTAATLLDELDTLNMYDYTVSPRSRRDRDALAAYYESSIRGLRTEIKDALNAASNVATPVTNKFITIKDFSEALTKSGKALVTGVAVDELGTGIARRELVGNGTDVPKLLADTLFNVKSARLSASKVVALVSGLDKYGNTYASALVDMLDKNSEYGRQILQIVGKNIEPATNTTAAFAKQLGIVGEDLLTRLTAERRETTGLEEIATDKYVSPDRLMNVQIDAAYRDRSGVFAGTDDTKLLSSSTYNKLRDVFMKRGVYDEALNEYVISSTEGLKALRNASEEYYYQLAMHQIVTGKPGALSVFNNESILDYVNPDILNRIAPTDSTKLQAYARTVINDMLNSSEALDTFRASNFIGKVDFSKVPGALEEIQGYAKNLNALLVKIQEEVTAPGADLEQLALRYFTPRLSTGTPVGAPQRFISHDFNIQNYKDVNSEIRQLIIRKIQGALKSSNVNVAAAGSEKLATLMESIKQGIAGAAYDKQQIAYRVPAFDGGELLISSTKEQSEAMLEALTHYQQVVDGYGATLVNQFTSYVQQLNGYVARGITDLNTTINKTTEKTLGDLLQNAINIEPQLRKFYGVTDTGLASQLHSYATKGLGYIDNPYTYANIGTVASLPAKVRLPKAAVNPTAEMREFLGLTEKVTELPVVISDVLPKAAKDVADAAATSTLPPNVAESLAQLPDIVKSSNLDDVADKVIDAVSDAVDTTAKATKTAAKTTKQFVTMSDILAGLQDTGFDLEASIVKLNAVTLTPGAHYWSDALELQVSAKQLQRIRERKPGSIAAYNLYELIDDMPGRAIYTPSGKTADIDTLLNTLTELRPSDNIYSAINQALDLGKTDILSTAFRRQLSTTIGDLSLDATASKVVNGLFDDAASAFVTAAKTTNVADIDKVFTEIAEQYSAQITSKLGGKVSTEVASRISEGLANVAKNSFDTLNISYHAGSFGVDVSDAFVDALSKAASSAYDDIGEALVENIGKAAGGAIDADMAATLVKNINEVLFETLDDGTRVLSVAIDDVPALLDRAVKNTLPRKFIKQYGDDVAEAVAKTLKTADDAFSEVLEATTEVITKESLGVSDATATLLQRGVSQMADEAAQAAQATAAEAVAKASGRSALSKALEFIPETGFGILDIIGTALDFAQSAQGKRNMAGILNYNVSNDESLQVALEKLGGSVDQLVAGTKLENASFASAWTQLGITGASVATNAGLAAAGFGTASAAEGSVLAALGGPAGIAAALVAIVGSMGYILGGGESIANQYSDAYIEVRDADVIYKNAKQQGLTDAEARAISDAVLETYSTQIFQACRARYSRTMI